MNGRRNIGQHLNQYVFVLIIFCVVRAAVSSWETNQCDPTEWPCDNGQCISLDDRCDGAAHCQDGSDEIAENCIHIFCPRYAFRCAYGACISGTSRCDGVKDCDDNSDENPYMCQANAYELEQKLSGNCRNTTMLQCNSGDCIDIENRCDGVKDCADGSDETVELCSYLFCPSYAFRCGYGGCVPGNSKCNGVADCVDGSDEAAELCAYKRKSFKPAKKPATTTDSDDCFIPFNRKALISQYLFGEKFVPLGTRVPTGSQMYFSCEPHYVLQGYRQSLCLNSNWKYPVPICEKNCAHSTLTKGISTTVHCNYEHRPLNCSDHLRIGAKAQVSCAAGYKLPKIKPAVHELTCDADGEWDYPKFKCVPQCGSMGSDRNGPKPAKELVERPWHVNIYTRNFDGNLQSICGGTIIAANLIVTAANCFMDNTNSLMIDAILYNVMLGNTLPELLEGEYQPEQLYNISEIVLSEKYAFLAPDHDYKHDVAVLVLVNNIDFALPAKPICLNQTKPTQQLLEAYEVTTLSAQQQRDLGNIRPGYALSEVVGKRHMLSHIVSHTDPQQRQGTDEVTLINANYYSMFIKKLMRRYKYIL